MSTIVLGTGCACMVSYDDSSDCVHCHRHQPDGIRSARADVDPHDIHRLMTAERITKASHSLTSSALRTWQIE